MSRRAPDGTLLLYMDDIGRMTGWKNETIRHYATAGRRARRQNNATPRDMPEQVDRVQREVIKGDGQPLVVWTPVWREDDIKNWLMVRGVKIISG